MLEKRIKYGKLYDYYNSILNNKHKEIVNQYYILDLSLKEISDNLGITRQGVYDLLKRAEKNLDEIDEKLDMINKQEKFKEGLNKKIKSMQKDIELNRYENFRKNLEELENLINKL